MYITIIIFDFLVALNNINDKERSRLNKNQIGRHDVINCIKRKSTKTVTFIPAGPSLKT